MGHIRFVMNLSTHKAHSNVGKSGCRVSERAWKKMNNNYSSITRAGRSVCGHRR
jgi:hypothetical protein